MFAVASCPGQGGYDAGYLYRCSMEGASSENEPYEAPHTVPVPPVGGLDIPLHTLTFRYELLNESLHALYTICFDIHVHVSVGCTCNYTRHPSTRHTCTCVYEYPAWCMITYIYFLHSLSGDYLFTGTASGVIRIHPLSDNHTISTGQLEHYWALSMHDNHYGAVTHLATSCDDSYLLSGGADGNVFVYQTNLPSVAAPSKEPPAAEITVSVSHMCLNTVMV